MLFVCAWRGHHDRGGGQEAVGCLQLPLLQLGMLQHVLVHHVRLDVVIVTEVDLQQENYAVKEMCGETNILTTAHTHTHIPQVVQRTASSGLAHCTSESCALGRAS